MALPADLIPNYKCYPSVHLDVQKVVGRAAGIHTLGQIYVFRLPPTHFRNVFLHTFPILSPRCR